MACRYEREGYGGSYGREPANYGRYYLSVEQVCGKVLSCISALLLLSGFAHRKYFNCTKAFNHHMHKHFHSAAHHSNVQFNLLQ